MKLKISLSVSSSAGLFNSLLSFALLRMLTIKSFRRLFIYKNIVPEFFASGVTVPGACLL